MTDAERKQFFDDLGRVFLRSAVREYLREIEEQMRRARESQACDERKRDHGGGRRAP